MAEPTVQVPVSMIHELVDTVGSKGMPTDLYLRFDAFLPQPTPTAASHFCTPGCTEGNCPVEPFTDVQIPKEHP